MPQLSPRLALLVALTIAFGACQHPPDPPAPPAPNSKPVVVTKPAAEPDEGSQRAEAVAAHILGKPAPALTLTTIDGNSIDLAASYGKKPVYLKFWDTWCIPCREQMPGFERIYETLGDQIQIIAVNSGLDDDPEAVRAFRTKYGLHMPIVIDDGRLGAALDLQVTPQHVLIDRDARIAFVGHLDDAKLDDALHHALAASATSPAAGQAIDARPALHSGDLVDLTATTADGKQLSISPTGRPRAIVLFATWCEGYLKDSVPKTSQACRRARERIDPLIATTDIDWLGVANNLWSSPGDLTHYRTKTQTKLPLAFDADGSVFRAFGVHHMPSIALIDRAGRLVRVLGPDEASADSLGEAVRALTTHP